MCTHTQFEQLMNDDDGDTTDYEVLIDAYRAKLMDLLRDSSGV
jgi:hypothetical protein